MSHKIATIAAAAVVVSMFGGVPSARAVTASPTGSLSCGAGGEIAFKPELSQTPSTKTTSVKLHDGSVGTCNNAGVTGGKYPISGGKIILNGRIAPGFTCSGLPGAWPLVKPQLIVKLTGLNARGKPATVAVIKSGYLEVQPSGFGNLITGSILQNKAGNKPFGGEYFRLQVNVDNLADAIGCLNGSNNLDHIDFSEAGGSTLTIAP